MDKTGLPLIDLGFAWLDRKPKHFDQSVKVFRTDSTRLQYMVAKLTVVFFIILCLEAGIALILLPWISIGIIGDWGNNYLLAFVVQKTGLPILRETVASGWFRGAVTGIGILNLFIAFWEIAHFKESVRMLEGPVVEQVKSKEPEGRINEVK